EPRRAPARRSGPRRSSISSASPRGLALIGALACALLAGGCDDDFLDIHLTVDSSPSWSPDGDSVIYAHLSNVDGQPSGIYVVDAASKRNRLVLQGDVLAVDWSPSGKAFVFAPDGYGLYVYDYARDSIAKIYAGRSDAPAWSPDSTQIAFDDESTV